VKDFTVCYSQVGSVQDEIRDLKERMIPVESVVPAVDSIFDQAILPIRIHGNNAIRQNGTWNTSVSTYNVYQYLVNGGSTYLFSGRQSGTWNSYFINWFDKELNFISHQYQAVYGKENLYERVKIVAPDNARYLMMNVLKADESYYSLNGLVALDYIQATTPNLIGKKISIIGDSISTAYNDNAVQFTVLESDITNNRTLQGYPTYYDIGTTIGGIEVTASMVGVLTSFTPFSGDEGKTIGKPLNYNSQSYVPKDKVWWNIMANTIGAEILQNVSWSGASISSHEGNQEIYKTSYAWHDAQIAKLAKRDSAGNVITPDIVIIYRGTNDMSHAPYSKITDFGASATEIPSTDVITDGYGFKEAYALTIQKIRQAYPMAEIICCTLNVFKRGVYDHFPTRNAINGVVQNTLPEFNNAIREVADQMGCRTIEFDKDGITFENCYPTYISDDSTRPTHPNVNGHAMMAKRAIVDILY
jgi:lysophospholipase L1-like esterase